MNNIQAHQIGNLVRRPRGGRKSRTPTPPPPPLPPAYPPRAPPRGLPRAPLDGPNFQGYRETVSVSPDENFVRGSPDSADHDPDDFADAEFFRHNRAVIDDDGSEHSESDASDHSNDHDVGRRRLHHRRSVINKSQLGNTTGLEFYTCLKVFVILFLFTIVGLEFYARSTFVTYMSSSTKARPYYQFTHSSNEQGQGQRSDQAVTRFVHLQVGGKNINITEEIFGGKMCEFDEIHRKISSDLGDYLKQAPAQTLRLHHNFLFNGLISFNQTLAEYYQSVARNEYTLCVYTELDVASNFITADYPLQDLIVFSNLYKNRLSSVGHEINAATHIADFATKQSRTFRNMAARCKSHAGQSDAQNSACEFLAGYEKNVDALIQRHYAPRLEWYNKMLELARVAEDILKKTVEVLEREAMKDVSGSRAPLRGFVQPFVTAMGGLIVTAKAGPPIDG